MWCRHRLQVPQLSLAERVTAADRAAATSDQDDAADYHDGTPDGQRPWWEQTTDTAAVAAVDTDGS